MLAHAEFAPGGADTGAPGRAGDLPAFQGAAILARGDAFDVLKHVSEIALIAKAATVGDLREVFFGIPEEIAGEIHAALAEQFGEGAAGALLEDA
jgi:hypothetical protein